MARRKTALQDDPMKALEGPVLSTTPNRSGTEKRTVWLPEDLHRRLKIRAAETGRLIADVLNEAVREYLGVEK